MHQLISTASVFAIFTLASLLPATAGGLTEAGELYAAQLNALAGGPIGARDKELLRRYGCLSGTRNSFCQAQTRKKYKRRVR